MKAKNLLAALMLLVPVGVAMAENGQTVTIGGQVVNQKATTLTFDGDSVSVHFADGTSQTADMSTVTVSFSHSQPVKGDVNRDTAVDVADISTIISVMTGDDQYRATADVNRDGTVDVADIASVISIMAGETAAQVTAEARQWDLTKTVDADVKALAADTDTWSYTEKNNRYESKVAFSGQLTAGQTVLELTRGLHFNAAEKKLRIDVGKRVQLAGKNVTVTIPGLVKGQQLTVTFASTGDNAVTFDLLTNLADAKGFVAADKNTTQTATATVAADGDVSFASSGGSINIFAIEVSAIEAVATTTEPQPQPIMTGETNDVARDTKQNQAVLTLVNGEAMYYNTADIAAINISADNEVTIALPGQLYDMFAQTVSTITFAKGKQEQEPVIENTEVTITEAKGWLESLYVEWDLVAGAKNYAVYVRGGQYSAWTRIDRQLVRNYGTYARADMVGLVAGTYDVGVAVADEEGNELPGATTSIVSGLEVKGYSRQGFAFIGGYEPGAYKADGSLKQGAKVFYVTKKTAKTIKTTVVTDAKGGTTECTGLQAIIAAYEKGQDTTPIAFRFMGLVEKDDLDAIGSSEEGLQVKGRKADSELNITFEGVGDDATLRGFGFLVRNAKSLEFRNFAIMRCMDDGISLDTNNSNVWVHHCDFFYGKHGSGDHDKGDGQVDVKSDSKFVTVSYNRFWDTGKTNMFGMKSESGPNYISYDHNWFDHSDSRHPRVRTMSVHVWNNYFDNVAKYGVGATTGASVFVENNYFLKTKKPILASLQGTDGLGSGTFSGEDGGMVKAYGNHFDRSAAHFSYYTQQAPSSKGYDAYETASRDEQVPESEKTLVGGTTYNNFDTNSQLMYAYTPDAAADVPAIVTGYYGAGRLGHGDFQYTFKDNVGIDDDDSAYDATLGSLLDSYKTALVGFFGEEEAQEPADPDNPDTPEVPEGTILVSFNGSPSNAMFTVSGEYGDGKITYDGTYYKQGAKLNSKTTVSFTPQKDYKMTLVLATTKSGRNVSLNGTQTTVGGTLNTEGAYYEMDPIDVKAGTAYKLTKGDAESILMLVKLEPTE